MSGCVKPANDSGRLTGRASRELLPFGDDTSDPREKKVKNEGHRPTAAGCQSDTLHGKSPRFRWPGPAKRGANFLSILSRT